MTHPPLHADLDSSIPDWLIDHPETAPVFQELGLDTSCAGKSLEYVCQQQGLDPAAVYERLRQAVQAAQTPRQP